MPTGKYLSPSGTQPVNRCNTTNSDALILTVISAYDIPQKNIINIDEGHSSGTEFDRFLSQIEKKYSHRASLINPNILTQ